MYAINYTLYIIGNRFDALWGTCVVAWVERTTDGAAPATSPGYVAIRVADGAQHPRSGEVWATTGHGRGNPVATKRLGRAG